MRGDATLSSPQNGSVSFEDYILSVRFSCPNLIPVPILVLPWKPMPLVTFSLHSGRNEGLGTVLPSIKHNWVLAAMVLLLAEAGAWG